VLLIIGAGVIGLSTAMEALNAGHRGDHITIVADEYSPETTSDGAGAIWRPVFLQDTPVELSDGWAQKTVDRCTTLGPIPPAVAMCFVTLLD